MQVELEFQPQTFAAKVLDSALLADYARKVTALAHPSLLRVLDVLADDEGRWALVRQATGGNWLAPERVANDTRANPPLSCSLILSTSEALAYLHQVGFRGGMGLSWEESIRYDRDGDRWSLGVFPPTSNHYALTESAGPAGILGFIAPELILDPVSPTLAADSFTLGALLFAFLAGERLIDGQDSSAKIKATLAGGFRTLSHVEPSIPEELSAFVSRALDADPSKRPSFREWGFVMEKFGGRQLPLPGPAPVKEAEGAAGMNDPLSGWTSVLPADGGSGSLRVLGTSPGRGAHGSSWGGEWAEADEANGQHAWLALPMSHDSTETERDEVRDEPPSRGDVASIGELDEPTPKPYLDEDVQFTVYRPGAVRPAEWYTLLAFAHLSELPPDASPDEQDPIERVKEEAGRALGEKLRDYKDVTQDSLAAVPREGEISLVPEMDGVVFNPPRCSFLWQESVHRAEFRLKAAPTLDGQRARGRLTVFLGSIILADIPLAIRVDSGAGERPGSEPQDTSACRPYRRIFASYSHKDLAIVTEFERYAASLGDRYLRDWVDLRAGEVWNDGLMRMIEEADVFQLFWSRNSMGSPFVRQEWEHALRLARPHFVRPVYWEEPLPEAPEQGLPPSALRRIHFQRILGGGGTHLPPEPDDEELEFRLETYDDSGDTDDEGTGCLSTDEPEAMIRLETSVDVDDPRDSTVEFVSREPAEAEMLLEASDDLDDTEDELMEPILEEAALPCMAMPSRPLGDAEAHAEACRALEACLDRGDAPGRLGAMLEQLASYGREVPEALRERYFDYLILSMRSRTRRRVLLGLALILILAGVLAHILGLI